MANVTIRGRWRTSDVGSNICLCDRDTSNESRGEMARVSRRFPKLDLGPWRSSPPAPCMLAAPEKRV